MHMTPVREHRGRIKIKYLRLRKALRRQEEPLVSRSPRFQHTNHIARYIGVWWPSFVFLFLFPRGQDFVEKSQFDSIECKLTMNNHNHYNHHNHHIRSRPEVSWHSADLDPQGPTFRALLFCFDEQPPLV